MNNSTIDSTIKVCGECKKELPATNDFFHFNISHGKKTFYSICKSCKKKKYKPKETKVIKCLHCGIDIITNRKNKKYCSQRCCDYSNRKSNAPIRKVRVSPKRIIRECLNCKEMFSGKRRYKYCKKCREKSYKKTCVNCNENFVSFHQTKRCSKCRSKDFIRKRKVYDEINDKLLTRAEVFKIEGYKCKCCGCKTEKKFSYIKGTQTPKPYSPTIDHIIPLNDGGTHTLKNIQLLCYKCNSRKQDGYLEEGEQLKMF